jgi:hypothetical protein
LFLTVVAIAVVSFWPEGNGAKTVEAVRQIPVVAEISLGQTKQVAIQPGHVVAVRFVLNPGEPPGEWGYRWLEREEGLCASVTLSSGLVPPFVDCAKPITIVPLPKIRTTTQMIVHNTSEKTAKLEFFLTRPI